MADGETEATLAALIATDDGPLAPSSDQWRRHLDRPGGEEIVLVNQLTMADPAALDAYMDTAVPLVRAGCRTAVRRPFRAFIATAHGRLPPGRSATLGSRA